MGFTSIWHWIVVLAVVLILFARPGKISGIMGDFGKGLKSFKDGMKGNKDKDNLENEDDIEVIDTKPKNKKTASKTKVKSKTVKKRASKTKSKS